MIVFLTFSSCRSLTKLVPVEAIFFDIDGTLCDSDPLHHIAYQDVLSEVTKLIQIIFFLSVVMVIIFPSIRLCSTRWVEEKAGRGGEGIGGEVKFDLLLVP
jgi:hypothetical protein